MRTLSIVGLAAAMLLWTVGSNVAAEPPRRVIPLDGVWQIAEGKMAEAPDRYERSVPVPGLVSLATPPFSPPPGPPVADLSQFAQDGGRLLKAEHALAATVPKDPHRAAFWYRRTFRLEQDVPAVAMIKVRKAMFGTRVILNGQVLGDHLPNFTPGYFNAKTALKTGDNELVIRVGADRAAVGSKYPNGFDFEKLRYIPGIFDSVELILSGTPHFMQVQTAANIAAKAVRVQAVLRNDGGPVRTSVAFVVREVKSGKVAGRLATGAISLAAGAEQTVDVNIPLADCRLWSPEDPFLYTLEADSGGDRFQTRFGMREFRLDAATGRAMLNGKPYFMRGSNITLYRFFEDEQCRDLPWRNDWVRLLHQRVKEMHWNCLRYCIGFPPEAWYDVADELGILIQDEFPIWYGGPGWNYWPKELKSDQLAVEFSEWMRERCNHPCVVIWDASNETLSSELAPAIRRVRGLDLSNRPWDNSYNPQLEAGDAFESHPYQFNRHFRLQNLATASPIPQGNPLGNNGKHAVIINEYGWHWLNRDGSPTPITRDIYAAVLGPESTAAERFHMQATWLAADTEFWRSHRTAAAVMHFTSLGYSRPLSGVTSDHWRDVAGLQWEPEFHRYLRDAFAPVGIMLDFWRESASPGEKIALQARVINDLDQPWGGAVRLRLLKQNACLSEQAKPLAVAALGDGQTGFEVVMPAASGDYVLEAGLIREGDAPVCSRRDVAVRIAGPKQPAAAKQVNAGAAAEKPAIAIDASKIGAPISKYVYGQFTEHLGRCIYGGIWAEMVEDRKFFYPVNAKESPWKSTDGATVTMVHEDAFVGQHTPCVALAGDQPRGISQGGMGLVQGKTYEGYLWLAASDAGAVRVTLVWGNEQKDRQVLTIDKPAPGSTLSVSPVSNRQVLATDTPAARFTKTVLRFTAGATTDNGQLEITAVGKGSISIGTVSLMPADNVHGMRADTLVLLKELDSPVYRWPGGNFVSGYNWKDGIGDRDRRPPRKNPAWKGVEHNDFGLDEFMVFCRYLKTEPYIAVNSGLGDTKSAVEEVEYANGAADTPMGQLRAKNGHPQPYNVKFWSIGNEMYGKWQLGHMPLEKYTQKHNEFAEAMRRVDPSIRLIGVGSTGKWSETMLRDCADHMDLLSEHFYCHELKDLGEHVRQIPNAVRRKAEAQRKYWQQIESLRGKGIRIALDEWNYWYGPSVFGELGTRYFLKDALGIAAGIHEMARQSDVIYMANYAQTVNVIGCIKTTKTAAEFETTGLVLKLYRAHFGTLPVATECAGPWDVQAAWSTDRKTLTIAVVNPNPEASEVPLAIKGAKLSGEGLSWQIAGADPMAYNDPGKPPKLNIEVSKIQGATDKLFLPPYSVTLFALDVK